MRTPTLFTLMLVAILGPLSLRAQVQRKWVDINPNSSTHDAIDPDGATGGRVNGLGRSANGADLYAASEKGGLYKSTDGGLTWSYLPGHLPSVTWDVEVDPSNANRVYATSWYDGRVNSLAGINVTTDAGATWTHPPSATPPAGFCDTPDRRDNPSAFGIAIDPGNTGRVFIGTNCGLAISHDAGVTWSYTDPTPADGADDIWDVVVHHAGIIDICGDDGHLRSTDGGVTWSTASVLPSGRCSITASPDEAYVLVSVVGTTIRETDDAGATWPSIITNPRPQGRVPFVATNDRVGAAFDLWFGDTWLTRAGCTTPAAPGMGGTARCPTNTWSTSYTRNHGAHDDAGDLLFAGGVAADACPIQFSSDGGVYRNTATTSPSCHAPEFEQPNVSPHALRAYSMAGADQATADAEDLYFGAQDNGSFATRNAGALALTWTNRDCCDVQNFAAEVTRAVYSVCCGTTIYVVNPGLLGGGAIATPPPGSLVGFRYPDAIANYAPNSYVAVTSAGVYITTNVGANPTAWSQLGPATSPASPKNVWLGVTAGTPTFYVQTGNANGQTPDPIWRFVGTTAGNWQQVNPPSNVGGFGVFAVDPVNPNRLFASHLRTGVDPAMILSTDGGATWTGMPTLDNLMTGGGIFRYRNTRGPASRGDNAGTQLQGYPMPTLVAFDSVNHNVMMAGGAESGVFLSLDAGATWEVITDQIHPTVSGTPYLPRPMYAYFDHDPFTFAGIWSILHQTLNVYVGFDGRGVWRFTRTSGPPFKGICGERLLKCLDPSLVRGGIILTCAIQAELCRFKDFIPNNCRYKFDCPGCRAGLCPSFYYIFLDELDPALWEVALFSKTGDPVPHEVLRTDRGVVVSFRPSRELYREGRIGDYYLAFAMRPGGKPGRYKIGARLETGSEPYSNRIAKR